MKKKYSTHNYAVANPSLQMRNVMIILVGLFVVLVASGLSVFFGSIVLFIVIGLILALLIFRYPFFGLLLFVGLIPLESTFSTIGGALTITRLLGLFILGLWALRVVVKRQQINFFPNAKFFIPFMLWAFLSVLWGADKDLVFGYWFTLLQMFAFVLLIYNEVVDHKQLTMILAVLVLSCLSTALLGYFRVGSLGERSLLSLESQGAKEYATMVGTAFLSCIILFSQSNNKNHRFLSSVAILICIYPIFAAGERGVLLGLVTGWIAVTLVGKRKFSNFGLAMIIGIAFYGIFQLAVQYELLNLYTVYRFSFNHIIETGGTGRMDIWYVAFNIIRNHPIIGVGLGNFIGAYQRYAPSLLVGPYANSAVGPHSDLIGVLAELGIIGFMLFLGLLSSMWISLIKMFRQPLKPEISIQATLLLGIWIYCLTISLSSALMYRKFYWLLIALVEVLIKLYQENGDKEESSKQNLKLFGIISK